MPPLPSRPHLPNNDFVNRANATEATTRRRIALALCAAAALVGLASCGTGEGSPPPQPTSGPRPIVVPLHIRWGIFGARPMIYVRVGNGQKVPVLLDTGSTGLHIYTRGLRLGPHSGVAVTSRRDAITYVDGMVQRGVVGRAKLTIGPLKTVHPVSFGVIENVSCVAEIPDCPGAAGINGRLSIGEYGILGVGLTRSRERLGNPLLALPRSYARSWSIELNESGGSLVLRPHLTGPPIARFSLARDGGDPTGARAWKDSKTKVCWATVDLRGDACEPTVFDTGSVTMLWYGGLLSHSNTSIDRVLVNPGEYIAAWNPGSQTPFWTFTSGTDFSHNTVIALRGGHPLVIAAVQAFLEFNIAYDDTRGQITLYPQSAP
jgi:hypothetical protein